MTRGGFSFTAIRDRAADSAGQDQTARRCRLILLCACCKSKFMVANSRIRVNNIFVKPACGERDKVVTKTVRCMGVRPCVRSCVRPSVRSSEFVRTITSTTVDGFQNNLTQLFFITCRYAV